MVLIDRGAKYLEETTARVRVGATDEVSGVVRMMLSEDQGFDGAAWAPFAGQTQWTFREGEGDKTLYAKFRDRAGNESEACSDTIILDTTPPGGVAVAIANDAEYVSSPEVVLGLEGDEAAFMQVSNDSALAGARWMPYSASVAGWLLLEPDEDGIKRVYARFRDEAGNRTEPVQDAVELDTYGEIAGTVRIVGDAAVAGVALHLDGMLQAVQFDEQGGFVMEGVPMDPHTVSASLADHEPSPEVVVHVGARESREMTGLRWSRSGLGTWTARSRGSHTTRRASSSTPSPRPAQP